MRKFAHIKDGTVSAITLWEDEVPPAEDSIVLVELDRISSKTVCVGDTYNGSEFIPAPTTPVSAPECDPIDYAEQWVGQFFSASRLLQMKMWWDALDHALVPKLAATYSWANGVTAAAASGTIIFSEPPHTFRELVEESVPLMQS